MAEDKKEPWLNYLALSTVILAVCATLYTFKGGGYSTRSVISQAQASNQWAYYQAKSIKGNLYQLQREKVRLELETLEVNSPSAKVSALIKRKMLWYLALPVGLLGAVFFADGLLLDVKPDEGQNGHQRNRGNEPSELVAAFVSRAKELGQRHSAVV